MAEAMLVRNLSKPTTTSPINTQPSLSHLMTQEPPLFISASATASVIPTTMRPATDTLFYASPMITPQDDAAATQETFTPPATIQRSPWHSPVPYLFGGLAAMLGLIAFALLILACSYWKLSGQVNDGEDGDERDVEEASSTAAEKCPNGSDAKAPAAFEEKFLVIMAGDVNPTFLATPMSSRASSFNDENKINSKNENQMEIRRQENEESSSQEQTQI